VFSTASVRDEYDKGLALRMYKAEDGMLRELALTQPMPQLAAAGRLASPRLTLAGATS